MDGAIGWPSPAVRLASDSLSALRRIPQQIDKRCNKAGTSVAPIQFNFKTQKVPRQGVLNTFSSKERLAPFKITTPNDGDNYFLKLVDANDKKKPIMTIFMNSGSTYETKVPLGTFVLRYASGAEWYGSQNFFGPCKTNFFEAQNDLVFSRSGNRLSGHRIELIKQVGGNLSTTSLGEEEF